MLSPNRLALVLALSLGCACGADGGAITGPTAGPTAGPPAAASQALIPAAPPAPAPPSPPSGALWAGTVNTAVPAPCHLRGPLPDPGCTPGAVNPAVTPATLATTICLRGWTATVRPPLSFTEPLKLRSMAAYGEPGPASGYEFDHLVPLELGGAPRDMRNLWPQPIGVHPGAAEKDRLENALHSLVCHGGMSLAQARRSIATDWVAAYAAAGRP